MGVGLAPGVLRSLLHPCRAGLCFCCLKPGTFGKETPELSPKNSLKACQKLFFFFFKANCSHCIITVSAVYSGSRGFLLI